METIKQTYKNYLLIPFIAVLLFSCDEKEFDLVLNLDNSYTFEISDDGVFEETKYITPEDILEQISDEELDKVNDINIESISIKIVPNDGNISSKVNIGGSLIDTDSEATILYASREVAFEDYTDFTPLSDLDKAGITLLTSKLLGYIKSTDTSSLTISAFGTSIPEGERIELDVIVKIRFTAKYTESLEVPYFIGTE
ncbi:hypothetical protein [Chondrinema litorale]|uniref:hypothetical protein n=1 Tax=Chondrinema litorale TaxID=2994555 RepID=UPI002543B821|nr:hypothetical protein [Chondrinema litorale]UZR96348.1 hypothetical protein OQ292_22070 [Chondrinema litorale]